MEIRKVSVSEIKPTAYNPRKDLQPGDPDYQKLKQSIATFGYVEPIVWNQQTGNLVGGHQRYKILIEQGLREVEVSVVDLSLQKEKVLNIALNKIQGQWDDDMLPQLLEELSHLPDIDVTLTGFDLPEISNLIDGLSSDKEDDFDFDASINTDTPAITQRGDLIELGPHKVLCGDSSNSEDLERLMGADHIHLVHTDPPYNVDYYGGNRPNAKSRPASHKQWERIYSDNMTQNEYETWLKAIFSNMVPCLVPGAPVYIWNGHKQFGPMYLMLKELEFHVSCVITWAKEHFAFGYGDYSQQTEFCLYGWKEDGGPHIWYGPNNETTLWQIKRDVTKNYIHPTQKPIAIPQRAIKNSSKRGDIVLDLFLGSGSTLIAAESLGRKCYGVEIDPKYVDGIVQRYITYAGRDRVSHEIKQRYLKEVHHG